MNHLVKIGNDHFLRLLPRELFTAKVTIAGSFAVNRCLQAKFLYNTSRPEVKVVVDNLQKLFRCVLGCAIMEDANAHRLSDTNCIGHLMGKGKTVVIPTL